MRMLIVTANSVYAAVRSGNEVHVTGRATFEEYSFFPTERTYSGQVVTRTERGLPVVGERMTFIDPDLGPVNTTAVFSVIELSAGHVPAKSPTGFARARIIRVIDRLRERTLDGSDYDSTEAVVDSILAIIEQA